MILFATAAAVALSFGIVGDQPVVFMTPSSGLTVTLSNITYDSFGRVARYTADVKSGSSRTSVAVKSLASEKGPLSYEVMAGSSRVKAATATALGSAIGFRPDANGIAARPGLKLKSRFAHDDFGRRNVAQQVFTDGKKTIEVAFSGLTRDSFGRVTGYRAEVAVK